jgi:very-short-patch-repair endonuclease
MQMLITRCGGLAATYELHMAGFSRHEIARAVRLRRILRVRQGWYAHPHTHRSLLAAARVGGRATCVTGLDLHGVWTPADPRVHVACHPHDGRLRSPRDSRVRLNPTDRIRTHWRTEPRPGSRLLLDPLECLRDAAVCFDATALVVAADSLLHTHPTCRLDWSEFRNGLPRDLARRLRIADGVCESGLETIVWLRIRGLGPGVRRQVPIARVGRVDFVVGERLVVEVDGEAYHTDSAQFEADRRRDAVLAALGYRVLRFSYRQVTERWPEVELAIAGAIACGVT